jgi:hypothetical protein
MRFDPPHVAGSSGGEGLLATFLALKFMRTAQLAQTVGSSALLLKQFDSGRHKPVDPVATTPT